MHKRYPRVKVCLRWAAFAAVLGACGSLFGQQGWTVKQEWVSAHESFLASDALSGRGSATHDEELTAAYVVSEFESYGLKPAPGMSGFLQAAEVIAPKLDGQSTLQVGDLNLKEGADFFLLTSSARAASGKLIRIEAADAKKLNPAEGAAVLVTGAKDTQTLFQAVTALRRQGVGLVLVPEIPAFSQIPEMFGGQTRTGIRLAEEPARPSTTMLLVHAEAAAKLTAPEGTAVNVTVHEVPQGKRYTFNAVGYLAGSDPAAGTLLLSAHLDHLGVRRPVDGDAIYNGANDDAAGTTAVLELAHALAAGPHLRRSVLFVCYGSEELGGLGSTYFGLHPPVPLKELVANLEFEMIGSQDPKMPAGVLLLTGWDRSNLGPTLKEHGALLGADPYPEQHFFERSDNFSLALKGVVAHTAAGWGTPPTYHRPNDDLAHLDLAFMTRAIQSLIEPVRWLANGDFRPQWNPGRDPSTAK